MHEVGAGGIIPTRFGEPSCSDYVETNSWTSPLCQMSKERSWECFVALSLRFGREISYCGKAKIILLSE